MGMILDKKSCGGGSGGSRCGDDVCGNGLLFFVTRRTTIGPYAPTLLLLRTAIGLVPLLSTGPAVATDGNCQNVRVSTFEVVLAIVLIQYLLKNLVAPFNHYLKRL